MSERTRSKAVRLLQIKDILLANPQGLSQSDIARRVKVDRATISRYVKDGDLDQFAIYTMDDGKMAINRDIYETEVSFNLHEAMAVHLAARLMATRMDKHNSHAATALRKLGRALEKLAPLISRHLDISAAVMDDAAQRYDPVYLGVLETLTQAWSQGVKAHVWHQARNDKVYEYDFAPYFIEPYAIGKTMHVIGFAQPINAQRTFKLERIRRAELTHRVYRIPEDFSPETYLNDAWGIWATEAEPVNVVLRFHPRVARRVQETQWHRSEEVSEQADGSLLWQAWIAEPQEMVNWIRGWGADVEVLEPQTLREMLVGEAKALAEQYGWYVTSHATNAGTSTLDDFFGG